MAVIIEDITDTFEGVRHHDDDAHPAEIRQDEDDEFHDAADSEDSYEDATEHFDADAVNIAQQRAHQAADAAGLAEQRGHVVGAGEYGDARTSTAQDDVMAPMDDVMAPDAAAAPSATSGQPQQQQEGHTPVPPDAHTQEEAAGSDDDGFAAAGPAYADEGERHGSTAAPAADQRPFDDDQRPCDDDQRPFDDDAWDMGQRFREPRSDGAGAESAEAPADPPDGQPPSADAAPPEEPLTPEEVEERTAKAEALKQEGNALYAEGKHAEAQAKYSEALDAAPPAAPQRAVYFANRAAVALKLQQWSDAAVDCTAALAIDGGYVKAYMRRASAYEQSDDLERALADYKKTLELDPGNTVAVAKTARLEPVVAERREKMKDEMIGKLKELGNTVLGKFGMSVDNFQAVKDPATGSYSINFQQ